MVSLGASALDCPIRDESGLTDFQKLPNHDGISIPRVGIERFRIPLRYTHPDGLVMNHDTEASLFISLSGDKTGINMSRLCFVLQEEGLQNTVDQAFFKKVLGRFRKELRDSEEAPLISRAELVLKFQYPSKQKSLKSDHWGWQYYPVELRGIETEDSGLSFELSLDYEYSSTCPCSLSLAKQYEEDFRQGKIKEGMGIATAHAQRSCARVTCRLNAQDGLFFEELIKLLRESIPTETQSMVKRVDERAFALINGENPIFVEHVARRIYKALEGETKILDWKAKIEHFESLHSHNAVATIQKVR